MGSYENKILCPSCGELCPEDAQFCKSCRSPITSFASIGPFESVFAEGAAYRSAFNSPTKPIVVIGVWLLFGPAALCGFVILWDAVSRKSEFDPSDIYMILVGAFFSLIGSYILYKTTRNFLKSKKEAKQDVELNR